MQEFNDLTLEERKQVYHKAFTFKHDHADHVETIVKNEECSVPPSGSDMFRPELWKPCHWRWFYYLKELI